MRLAAVAAAAAASAAGCLCARRRSRLRSWPDEIHSSHKAPTGTCGGPDSSHGQADHNERRSPAKTPARHKSPKVTVVLQVWPRFTRHSHHTIQAEQSLSTHLILFVRVNHLIYTSFVHLLLGRYFLPHQGAARSRRARVLVLLHRRVLRREGLPRWWSRGIISTNIRSALIEFFSLSLLCGAPREASPGG